MPWLGNHNRGAYPQLLLGLSQAFHQTVIPVVVPCGRFKQQGHAQRALGLAVIRIGGGAGSGVSHCQANKKRKE